VTVTFKEVEILITISDLITFEEILVW